MASLNWESLAENIGSANPHRSSPGSLPTRRPPRNAQPLHLLVQDCSRAYITRQLLHKQPAEIEHIMGDRNRLKEDLRIFCTPQVLQETIDSVIEELDEDGKSKLVHVTPDSEIIAFRFNETAAVIRSFTDAITELKADVDALNPDGVSREAFAQLYDIWLKNQINIQPRTSQTKVPRGGYQPRRGHSFRGRGNRQQPYDRDFRGYEVRKSFGDRYGYSHDYRKPPLDLPRDVYGDSRNSRYYGERSMSIYSAPPVPEYDPTRSLAPSQHFSPPYSDYPRDHYFDGYRGDMSEYSYSQRPRNYESPFSFSCEDPGRHRSFPLPRDFMRPRDEGQPVMEMPPPHQRIGFIRGTVIKDARGDIGIANWVFQQGDLY